MSVTFRCRNTQYVEVVQKDDVYGDWTDSVPVEPYVELNLSNSNAWSLIAMLDQTTPPDYCGEWAGQKLHVVRETCFRILNTRPHLWESPTVQDGNFITCGRNEDYVGRKLTAMLELLAVATKLGDSVVWS